MAKDLNKVQVTGRLGADPEMRYTAQGNAVTTFRIASNRSWRTAEGESHEDTEWFRVVAWNKLAEICYQWLSKGSRLYVEGRMQTRQWQDQEGQTRYLTEVIANDIIIFESRRGSAAGPRDDMPTPAEAPTSRARATSHAAPERQQAAASAVPAKAARVAALPRGKDAFEEEDLPF